MITTHHYARDASLIFFFKDMATTEIYTLSLHDALPISARRPPPPGTARRCRGRRSRSRRAAAPTRDRKSTRLNSSHANISYAVFCLKKKKTRITDDLPPPRGHTATTTTPRLTTRSTNPG